MALLDFGPYGTQAPDDPYQLALMMSQQQAPQQPDFEANLQNVAAPVPTTAPDPLAEYRSVMSRKPGFFQENAPLILGLLGGVSGLLEAMGPSRVPVSGGQVFARGLQSGLSGVMGGLKYQQGMESARQQEATNILNALGKEQNIQAALDKRKANNQLRSAIPQMIEDLSSAEGLTARDKILIAQAERLREASPTTSLNILNQIASKSDQFQFFNLGDGKIAKINKVEGTTEIISGEGAGSVMDIGTMPYEDAPVKSEQERALFYLQQAPRDSQNYRLAYEIYSQPKFSTSGAILTPNMTALGFLPPIAKGADQTPSLIDSDQTTQTQAASGTKIQKSDLGTATVTKVVNLKQIPKSENSKFRDVSATVNAAKKALTLLKESQGARDAVGFLDQFKTVEGPKFMQQMGLKLDKDGRDLLAEINDIQSLTLLERSGAAVTVPEFQRARPFLPERGDGEETLMGKLQRLVEIYETELGLIRDQYNPDTGYQGFPEDLGKPKWLSSYQLGADLSVEDIKEKYGVE